MPRTALRVVCGQGDTMEIFSFPAVFKKLDFPAEGLPIIATTADLLMQISIIESDGTVYAECFFRRLK